MFVVVVLLVLFNICIRLPTGLVRDMGLSITVLFEFAIILMMMMIILMMMMMMMMIN